MAEQELNIFQGEMRGEDQDLVVRFWKIGLEFKKLVTWHLN